MTKQVWKFKLQPVDYIASGMSRIVAMPRGAKALCANAQDDWVCLWSLVDVGNEPEDRRFVIYGTSHDIDQRNLSHVSSFQAGALVFHVFEVKP